MPIVEARVPKSGKLLWVRKKTDVNVTFKDLIQFEIEVEVKETADRDSFTSNALKQRDEITEVLEDYQADMSTATALHIKPLLKCTFCSGNHRLADCTVLMTVDDRFRAVREDKTCFRCAVPRHRVSSCRWKKPCECVEMPTWNNTKTEDQAPKNGRKREGIWAPERRKKAESRPCVPYRKCVRHS